MKRNTLIPGWHGNATALAAAAILKFELDSNFAWVHSHDGTGSRIIYRDNLHPGYIEFTFKSAEGDPYLEMTIPDDVRYSMGCLAIDIYEAATGSEVAAGFAYTKIQGGYVLHSEFGLAILCKQNRQIGFNVESYPAFAYIAGDGEVQAIPLARMNRAAAPNLY